MSEGSFIQAECQIQSAPRLTVAVDLDPPAPGGHIEPLVEVVVRNNQNYLHSSIGWM